jgi:hypothetical protein
MGKLKFWQRKWGKAEIVAEKIWKGKVMRITVGRREGKSLEIIPEFNISTW